MPGLRRPQTDAAEALLAVAPLASRWIERLLAQHNPPLTVSQYLALRAITQQVLTASELARRTGVSGSAVSQLLAGLEQAGLLERRPDPDDRRHQALSLSIRGRRVHDSAHALLRGSVAELIGHLPRHDAEALSRLLPHVQAALSGTPPPRKSPHPRPRQPPPKRPHPPRRGP
jgi:DNA-binding MarR family transcriptional regulator